MIILECYITGAMAAENSGWPHRNELHFKIY